MKKILLLFIAFLLFQTTSNAQNFLNKIKQKAEEAVNQRLGGGNNNNNQNNNQENYQNNNQENYSDFEIPNYNSYENNYNDYDDESQSMIPNTEKMRTHEKISIASWDDPNVNIKPATGSTFEELIAQLPSLPTPEQLANPTEDIRKAYYTKIASVQLRIEQLFKTKGCTEQDEEALQKKLLENSAAENGITVEELELLQKDDTPEATRNAIIQKMMTHKMGGNNAMFANGNFDQNAYLQKMGFSSMEEMEEISQQTENMEKEIEKLEKAKKRKLTEIEQIVLMRDKYNKVYKYTLKNSETQMGISAEMTDKFYKDWETETTKKGRDLTHAEVENILNTKYPTLAKQMKDAENKSKQQTSEIHKQAQKQQSTLELMQREIKLEQKTMKNDQAAINECNKYSDKYIDDLKAIYTKLVNTNDREQINALYAQAETMVKDYRINASKIWLANIQKHIDLLKNTLPEKIQYRKDLIEYNMGMECSINEEYWNCVTDIINDLHDAFAEFPEIKVQPVQVKKTNIKCYRYESVIYPFVTGFEQKSKLSPDGKKDFNENYNGERIRPAYGTYKSPDGKRVVVFASDGSLTMPDGSTFYPIAFEQQNETLVWYEADDFGNVYEYKYKL
ncbi:MAG: hypothetical protein MJ211_15165 [Bacteroidales bacterium]|nr:hypothetical protein [Bacteroidales bacterium]